MLAGAARHKLLTLLVGAAVGVATYGTVEHLRDKGEAPAPPVVIPAPPPPPATEPSPAATANVAVEPAAAQRPTAAPGRARAPGPSLGETRDLGLAAERKLIETARTALARGRIDGALAALHRHVRSFPRGQLAEERESLFVQALVAKGHFALARQRALRFEKQYPRSLFQPVVEESLRSIP
jgi:TolA-binding protein